MRIHSPISRFHHAMVASTSLIFTIVQQKPALSFVVTSSSSSSRRSTSSSSSFIRKAVLPWSTCTSTCSTTACSLLDTTNSKSCYYNVRCLRTRSRPSSLIKRPAKKKKSSNAEDDDGLIIQDGIQNSTRLPLPLPLLDNKQLSLLNETMNEKMSKDQKEDLTAVLLDALKTKEALQQATASTMDTMNSILNLDESSIIDHNNTKKKNLLQAKTKPKATTTATTTTTTTTTKKKSKGKNAYLEETDEFRAERVVATRASISRKEASQLIKSKKVAYKIIRNKQTTIEEENEKLTPIKSTKLKIPMNSIIYMNGIPLPPIPPMLMVYHKAKNVLSAMDEKHSKTKQHLGMFLTDHYKKVWYASCG